jgi:hypothetical protein
MIRATLATVAVLALSGCGPDLSVPTTTTRTTGFISGIVNPSESGWNGLTVSILGNVDLTLVSLVAAAQPQRPINVPVRLSLGTVTGDTAETQVCTDFISAMVTPGLTTQLTSYVHPGTYCARVEDSGNRLTEPATFTVRETSP